MEKVKLTYVNHTDKTSKAGKPFTSCSIKTDKYGDQYLNGFGNVTTKSWKVGDEVEIEVKKVEVGGKEYLNFEGPKGRLTGSDAVQIILHRIEAKVDQLLARAPGIDSTDDFPAFE